MKKYYRIYEWKEVRDKFLRLMPDIPVSELRDGEMTVFTGHLKIDPVKLGDVLSRLYPEEWEELSSRDIIERHYGAEAVQLIEALL